jgi:hypothetical protein
VIDVKRLLASIYPPSEGPTLFMCGGASCTAECHRRDYEKVRAALPDYEAAVDALEGLVAAVQSSSRQFTEPWGEGQWTGVGVFVGDLEPEFGEALEALARLRGEK